jgi:hypothetical protein
MNRKFIRKYQKKLEEKVKQNDKSLLAMIYSALIQWARPLYFKDEFLLLNGLKKPTDSRQQSMIFFTVHKSASTFIKNTVMELLAHEPLTVINFSGYLSKKAQESNYNNAKKMSKALRSRGFFYGAFRAFYHFPDMDQYKILLVLRDPRDVLNSYYFSTLYNHPLGRKEVFDERGKYSHMDIDSFVLEKAPEFKKKYQDFCQHLLGRPNVLFLKYEDMISVFPKWLQQLSDFLEIKNNNEIQQTIVNKTQFKVNKEDKHSFIRSIKAQDYKDKLKPETIKQLTELFKEELIQLNYSLD